MNPLEIDAICLALNERGMRDGAALATLIRSRGPVFRRAGARMLVFGDGTIVRGLSAGCPEADIAARAREVIDTGQARVLRYDREHGYDALLELGCGGEMEVLVEPLREASDLDHLNRVSNELQERRSVRLATVFAVDGQGLPRPRRALWSDGIKFDGLGDDELLDSLHSIAARETSTVRVEDVRVGPSSFQVLLERAEPALALVLLGVNASSLALAKLAQGLGWPATIVDHRDAATAPNLIAGCAFLSASPDTLIPRAHLDARTAVVVMTHNLERDLAYLRALEHVPLAYLGAMGSRQRAAKMRAALGASARPLHVPAGLDIGSEMPEEIALAIAAEIQAASTRHAGGRLSHGDGPIH